MGAGQQHSPGPCLCPLPPLPLPRELWLASASRQVGEFHCLSASTARAGLRVKGTWVPSLPAASWSEVLPVSWRVCMAQILPHLPPGRPCPSCPSSKWGARWVGVAEGACDLGIIPDTQPQSLSGIRQLWILPSCLPQTACPCPLPLPLLQSVMSSRMGLSIVPACLDTSGMPASAPFTSFASPPTTTSPAAA